MDQAGQEGTRREHHGPGVEDQADLGHDAGDPVAVQDQVVDRLLEERQVRLVFEAAADRPAVEHAIGLGAGGPDRRSLAGVEDPELDARLVRGDGHRAAQGVHFLDEMPLADPSDRGIAGHLAEGLDTVGEQKRVAAHAGARERGFGAGVTAAHHDDVETVLEIHGLKGVKGAAAPRRKEFTAGRSREPLFHVKRAGWALRDRSRHQLPGRMPNPGLDRCST